MTGAGFLGLAEDMEAEKSSLFGLHLPQGNFQFNFSSLQMGQ